MKKNSVKKPVKLTWVFPTQNYRHGPKRFSWEPLEPLAGIIDGFGVEKK